MSALAIIFNLDGRPVEPAEIDAMVDSLIHRGMDARNVRRSGTLAMAHRMRWTTPESFNERLPRESTSSGSVIVSDARIDNRVELMSQLGIRSEAEIADSEIILRAYEKWGEECPEKIIGDFVFAIWDARNESVFCARDPLGVRHFYYSYSPKRYFVLASEIKALLQFDDALAELNEEHLADYLVVNAADKESTFYRNIRRLPAAHSLTVSRHGLRKRCYFVPSPKEIRLKNDAAYHEAFREKFTEAVECRLRSAVPVGSTLSGGLDSSSVVCVASEFLRANGRPPLQTFSAVFPTIAAADPRIDEMRYIQTVIERTGATPHFVNVDDASPLDGLDRILWHTDIPIGHLNVYMESRLLDRAQQQGVKVLLSGHDGDATVTYGYQEFEHLARRGRFLKLLRYASALERNMPSRHHSVKNMVWNYGIKQAIPAGIVTTYRRARGRAPRGHAPFRVNHPLHLDSINPDFRARSSMVDRLEHLYGMDYPQGSSPPERHWQSLTNGLFSSMHEQLEKLSAAYGIEPRHPFFDRRLIEFCIGLPPGQRVYKGWTRSIFRYAMNGILPPEIQWRTDKANLGAHIKINLLQHGSRELKRLVERDVWKIQDFIKNDVLKNAYKSFAANSNACDAEALLLLTSMYLLRWFELSGFAKKLNPAAN